jgi:predicted transcriptional regulator
MELKVGDYMSHKPFKIESNDTLTSAIDLMSFQRIGNLVVKEDGHIRGILTEREILGHLASEKMIEGTQITDLPLNTFTVVGPQTNIIDAARFLISQRTRLLVCEDKKLIGILTATDMVRAFRNTSINPKLEKVISNDLFTVKDSDDILKAVRIMNEKKIGSVIVTKHNIPHGIFTERDLLVDVLSYNTNLRNPVIDFCSYPLITAELGIGGGDAAKIMAENEIKRLVLTRDRRAVAIVTARDVVDAFQSSFSSTDF